MRNIFLPTGRIIIDDYQRGELETLSIGDYGKDKNIKADFLGFSNEINGVANGPCKPLSEKWVMTLSTQYGCSMNCSFCDAPNVKFNGNASLNDLKKQFINAREAFREVKYTDRLNIHFARMGEPVFNTSNIIDFAEYLYKSKKDIQEALGLRIETIHPVFTTMCPKTSKTKEALKRWNLVKNYLYNGQAGLQLSINSTDEATRQRMFNNKAMSLEEISKICSKTLDDPIGRKYCLNFAYASGVEIDGNKLLEYFDPDDFMVKITPIHNNNACKENGFETVDGYCSYDSYREVEESCKKAGFDVLVFVPSSDEEDSTITCGNAILGGSKLKI